MRPTTQWSAKNGRWSKWWGRPMAMQMPPKSPKIIMERFFTSGPTLTTWPMFAQCFQRCKMEVIVSDRTRQTIQMTSRRLIFWLIITNPILPWIKPISQIWLLPLSHCWSRRRRTRGWLLLNPTYPLLGIKVWVRHPSGMVDRFTTTHVVYLLFYESLNQKIDLGSVQDIH